jgi:hypothetical protein
MSTDVRAAAERLKSAIDRHLEACVGKGGEEDPTVQAAYDALREAAKSYDDVLYDAYDEVTPFEFSDFSAEDDDEAEPDGVSMPGITVLLRRDYLVADEAAVLAEGRAAYLRVWPDDDEAAAAADVRSLGRALYQVAHADGWDKLEETPGLEPMGGSAQVFPQLDMLPQDPEEWPGDLFAMEGARCTARTTSTTSAGGGGPLTCGAWASRERHRQMRCVTERPPPG